MIKNNETTLNENTVSIINEKKTARIEISVQPTIKALAKEKAKERNEDLSKILSQALVKYLAT
jgi:uncharacterized Fe-S cluster-containing radical SAM superfamily enzyme